MKQEPVLVIVGGVGSLITAVIALLVAFGIHVTQDQAAAIMGVVGVLTSLVTAFVSRTQVTPTAVENMQTSKENV